MTITYKTFFLVTAMLAVTCIVANDAQNDRPIISDVKDMSVDLQVDDDIGKAEDNGEMMDEFMNVEGKDAEDEDLEDIFDSIFEDSEKPRKGFMSRGIRWRKLDGEIEH